MTQVAQDWEGTGQLTTTTQYLTGFKTQVTNPRNYATITGFMVFDQPTNDWPVDIDQADGQTEEADVDIGRDIFGKPTAITRHNPSAHTDTGDSTAAKDVPPGAKAVIHGHIESGPKKANGLVDRPNPKQPLGDSQPLTVGLPNGTVFKGNIGWHEIVNGQLQFRYPAGAVNADQQQDIQNNLNAEQVYFQSH